MLNRILLFVGLVPWMLALGGLVLRFTRFPRATLASGVSGEVLLPPASTPTPTPAPTPTSTSTSTPTPTSIPTETPGALIVHVVQRGENLFRIALKYNTTVEAIAAANDIRNPQLIYVGQRLIIPQGGGTTSPLVPKAVISGPTSGLVGETLSFSGADSTDPDGHIVSYVWDFGDGTTGSGVNVTHSYSMAGSYKVTLTVTDNGGSGDSATHTVQINEPTSKNQPPKAVIRGPTSGLVGETLSFSGSDSTDSDGRIVSYAWDFGDGTTGSGVNVTHVYTTAGSYQVTLTVTDDGTGVIPVPVPIDFAPYIWAKAGTLPHIWGALPTFSVWTYSLDSQDDDLSDSASQNVSIYEPTAMVEAEWPKKMEIDRSDSIRVSLVRTTGQVFVPTIEIAGHTVIAASPIPFGTPKVPLERAFGPGYKASAIANLAGTAFKITSVTTEYQSLEQPRITWEWNIMPEKPGPQTINANIQIQWEPIGGDGETIQRPIWRSRLDILVEKPLIATDQLSVTSLLSGFVGSALSIPWLYSRIKERREERQKDEESKPKIYLP